MKVQRGAPVPTGGTKLGYSAKEMADVNRQSIALLDEIRKEYAGDANKIVISGCLGPRGDGYKPVNTMSEKDAESYHRKQIQTFEDTAADMVTAITMNYAEEAVGIAQAAKYENMPVVISFTVETDGRLPSGQTLRSAIEQVDSSTSLYPSFYMINCACQATKTVRGSRTALNLKTVIDRSFPS